MVSHYCKFSFVTFGGLKKEKGRKEPNIDFGGHDLSQDVPASKGELS